MRGRAGINTKRLRDYLDRALFRPAPPTAMRFSGWEGVVLALSGLAVWVASAAHVRSAYLRALLLALTILPRRATASCEARHLPETPAFVVPEGWSMTFSCNRLESADGAAPAR